MALLLLYFLKNLSLSLPPDHLLYGGKKTLYKSQLLFKDCESLVFLVSVDCNRMPEQVDHSLYPNGSHCYFKRADICWRAERGSFQRNDESPVLDCSERGPHERMRTWQEGWKGEKKRAFKQQSPLFLRLVLPFSHFIFPFCTSVFLCTSFLVVWTLLILLLNINKSIFLGIHSMRHMYLAFSAAHRFNLRSVRNVDVDFWYVRPIWSAHFCKFTFMCCCLSTAKHIYSTFKCYSPEV